MPAIEVVKNKQVDGIQDQNYLDGWSTNISCIGIQELFQIRVEILENKSKFLFSVNDIMQPKKLENVNNPICTITHGSLDTC